MEDMTSALLTAKDLARLLGVSRSTIYRLARAGVIPSYRFRTLIRFDRSSVEEWLRAATRLRENIFPSV